MSSTTRRDFIRSAGTVGAATGIGLAGDVAARAVELLNDGALGSELPAEKTVCRSCHYMGQDFAAGQFTIGEMNCLTCHIDLQGENVTASGHAEDR